MIILDLEKLIKNHISSIDRIKIELKKHREMLEDVFINDPTYKLHAEKAKEANKLKSSTKQQIARQPNVANLLSKVKGMREEVKGLEGALSDYLREYQRLSGVNEIEGEDGEVREIVYVAKLVKRSSRQVSKN